MSPSPQAACDTRLARFQGNSAILAVALSPVAKTLVYGSTAANFSMIDLTAKQPTTVLNETTTARPDVRHKDSITYITFRPDGRILATASRDREIKLWDVETGKLLAVCRGHTDAVNSLSFRPDGRILASGSDDRTVRLWDAATGKKTVPLMGHTDKVVAVAFSPDGETLASASSDGTIKLWQLPMLNEADR
jgi:WD40 repeat protein